MNKLGVEIVNLHTLAYSRENNFDFLRFFAVSLVIISHTYPLSGAKYEPFALFSGYDTFGGLAVSIFFVISGFLIKKSWSDNPNLLVFFSKRFLRIFPALICTLLFAIFIIGPLVTTFNIGKYFIHPQTRDYLANVFLFPIYYNLPGVFTYNPYPNAVNGSLWTLPVEFIMYFSVPLFGVLGILFKEKIFIPFMLLLLLFLDFHLLAKPEYQSLVIYYILVVPSLKLTIFFLAGSLFYVYREKIFLNSTLAFLALSLYFISFQTPIACFVSFFTLPYLVIYIAFVNIPFIRHFGKYGDFSYGMYIYAFPIQQTLMYLFAKYLNLWNFFIFAYLITFIFAFFSWHFVEKPALKLKKSLQMKQLMTASNLFYNYIRTKVR